MADITESIRQRLAHGYLLCDGAFGTYYALKYHTDGLPERANTQCPERVAQIHADYLAVGAQLLRTNTYASNTAALKCSPAEAAENIRSGFRIAKEAARGSGALVAADIGPIPWENISGREAAEREYADICRVFLEEGAEVFVFETFSDMDGLNAALDVIGDKAFVVVQFAVSRYGYGSTGLSAKKLLQTAQDHPYVDAAGLNCGIGPAHMQQLFRRIGARGEKPLTAFPNAGYPQGTGSRMIFPEKNVEYFVQKADGLLDEGVTVIGGCCGTTPAYIAGIRDLLERRAADGAAGRTAADGAARGEAHVFSTGKTRKNSAFYAKKTTGKLIAVELAPPFDSDDEKLMDAAHRLQKSGVDVLTFPDSPSGRTRADSVLTAEKVSRETGMCVMPHICCRDRNAIAIRSQLFGAYMNGIYNFLVVTGDPIPAMARGTVKGVFNFDSIGLMRMIDGMNEEHFSDNPLCFGGAINPCRKPDFEINRVKKKMEAGATFFLTQPIATEAGAAFLRRVKEETGARILCGVMPFVSLRNALFMKNEMAGIAVTDEVLARYRADMTREEGEQAGIALARDVIAMTERDADGYYFSFPFNRVGMLERIL